MASKNVVAEAFHKLRDLLLRRTHVGTDANGNRYYRWTETLQGEVRERRQVRVKGGDILYDPKIIPPEWRAWLAKTRQEPPADEELARNAQRASLMAQRIAAIEERERQRRYRMDSLGQAATPAGGPDMGRFVAQLQGPGRAAAEGAQQQQQQQQEPPPPQPNQ